MFYYDCDITNGNYVYYVSYPDGTFLCAVHSMGEANALILLLNK